MVSEAKTGVCKYCGSPYHRGWQCRLKPKKEKKKLSKPGDERNKLIKSCDKLFSEYTRRLQRQTLRYNRCFICGKKISFEESQIGHYVRRSYIATRYLPEFCQVNCFDCNVVKSGNLKRYRERLVEEYGEDFVREKELSKNRKVDIFELKSIEQDLKQKLKGLQTNKNMV